jgi:hypothetical protein
MPTRRSRRRMYPETKRRHYVTCGWLARDLRLGRLASPAGRRGSRQVAAAATVVALNLARPRGRRIRGPHGSRCAMPPRAGPPRAGTPRAGPPRAGPARRQPARRPAVRRRTSGRTIPHVTDTVTDTVTDIVTDTVTDTVTVVT